MAFERTAASPSSEATPRRAAKVSRGRSDTPTSWRSRWRRRGVFALLGLVAVYATYVLVFNLAFATGLLAKLVNRASPDFHMELGSAWTLLPGRVHVKDCSLRVEDGDLQFFMTLPEAVVDLDPIALFRRRVRFRQARVTDVRYSFREKVEGTSDARSAMRVAFFPKIPGFADIPLRDPAPPKERTPEEIAKLWSVQVDDVSGTMSELWFDEYHYRGSARVDGAFALEPLRTLTIGPTRLELLGGEVTVGDEVVASSLTTTLKVSLPTFDVREVSASGMILASDLAIELSTRLVSLPLRLYADDVLRLGPNGGRLELSGAVKEGVPTPGSRLALEVDTLVQKAPMEARASARLNGEVREDGRAEVIARIPSATLVVGDEVGKTSFAVRGIDVRGYFAVPRIDRASFEGGSVVLASADAPDLLFLSRLLGEGVPRAGKLHASFRGSIDGAGVARGKLQASARDVDIAFTGARIGGGVDVTGAFSSGPGLSGGRFTDARIASPKVTLQIPGVPARSTTLGGTAQELAWTGLVPRTLTARAFVQGNDARILTAIVEKEEGVEAMAARSLVGQAPFSAGGSVNVEGGVVRARIGQAVAGKVSVTGGLVEKKAGLDAAFLLRALGLSIGLSVAKGEVGIKPLASSEWLGSELGRLGLLGANEKPQSSQPAR